MRDNFNVFISLAKYNLKIVFGGKFLWFVFVATLFFLFLLFMIAYQGEIATEDTIYNQLLFPALLLVFYPTVYGLQNDEENKILEILFTIPNYMYKVWLLRFVFVLVECFLILLFLSSLAYILMTPVPILEMSIQLMMPVLFFGTFGFFLSTAVKGGNGAAVIFIVVVVVALILSGSLSSSLWNIFISPFKESDSIHPTVWADTLMKNRLLLTISSFGFVLMALMNLQKRERLL